MTKLEQLKAALEAATPEEWGEDDGFVAAGHGDTYRTVADARCDVAPFSDANTEFIILAHNLMPTLIEAVELLRAVHYEHNEYDDEYWATDLFKRIEQLKEKLK